MSATKNTFFRENNNNWKGGRTIASNGYVLIRVGTKHLSADVRGYMYEHRLVMENHLGRRLNSGEIIHHRNGIKTDNRLQNLEIMKSAKHHFRHHRKSNSNLRTVDEENPIILCACGCNAKIKKYDNSDRPREYVSGHNPQEAKTQNMIENLLRDEKELKLSEIIKKTELSKSSAKNAIVRLLKKNRLVRIKHGVYVHFEKYGSKKVSTKSY